eukprot:TRINITY_DN4392_c0_g1_i2.p1 TRINITY_DN4392_c0_g1~~TRINITY_DN4392_c0_g1_i2.p1  ORF type:complete len:171 (+),score=42.50 TRINITY_DN4392_c0_g1_i2:75-515(+)
MDFKEDLRRAALEYRDEMAQQIPGNKSTKKFPYATLLTRSADPRNVRFGIGLLQEILHEKPDEKRDTLYYLALAHYRLQEYLQARQYAEVLLRLQPENRQIQQLKAVMDEQIKKDGLIGIGIVSGIGALAAVAAVGGFIIAKTLAK